MNYANLVQEAVKSAKQCKEDGRYDQFRQLFGNLVYWRYTDALRKKGIKVKDDEASALEGKNVYNWQTRTISTESSDEDVRPGEMNPTVMKIWGEISLEKASKAENIKLVRETLNFCQQTGRLTPEQIDMLCHYYGIGKNYQMMNQTEIAKKLGVSTAYVCNRLKEAYEVMRNFIEDDRSAA